MIQAGKKLYRSDLMRIYLASLGCAKNQVDSEVMQGRLIRAGHRLVSDPENAHAIVVNTCSFIQPASEESIDTILELARYKQEGSCRRLIVAGCLPERYREEIATALPEVDQFLGTGAFDQIVSAVEAVDPGKGCILPDPGAAPRYRASDIPLRPASTFAYIKIAEGCNRRCTYCIIPRLRGRQKSRQLPDILEEARGLVEAGTRELILVAQDSTDYGSDLSPPIGLDMLLQALAPQAGEAWIRVMYGHPSSVTEETIAAVAVHDNICTYFDLPIQHASDRLLTRMGRHYTRQQIQALFSGIRGRIPEATLRTTVITGFPGETDDDYQQLVALVEEVKFDHLGVFTYSDAEDLPSYALAGKVDAALADERRDGLMLKQAQISATINATYVGRVLSVLIESVTDTTSAVGRTVFQAPEVDGVTIIKSEPGQPALKRGQLVDVKIIDNTDYDLVGVLA
jgi:ribosomal protein S12 methylthiotransferase